MPSLLFKFSFILLVLFIPVISISATDLEAAPSPSEAPVDVRIVRPKPQVSVSAVVDSCTEYAECDETFEEAQEALREQYRRWKDLCKTLREPARSVCFSRARSRYLSLMSEVYSARQNCRLELSTDLHISVPQLLVVCGKYYQCVESYLSCLETDSEEVCLQAARTCVLAIANELNNPPRKK